MLSGNLILLLVIQTALILGLSRIMGSLFVRFRQPQVMGEMVAGIMLGPSLFGLLLPNTFSVIFPANSIEYLNALSQVGVIFFLFLIGLELDPKLLRNRGHAALVISHASIIAPFLLGGLLTLYLYPHLFNNAPSMRFTAVALFLGASMSITAFPVLARILTERNMHRTEVGTVAITCAAVDDVTAWCLLAFVVAVARASGLGPGLWTAGKSAIYVCVMFFMVRPFLKRLELVFQRRNGLSQNLLAFICVLVLLSAMATELIGIHALFGAFVMGAIMPKGTNFVKALMARLEDFVVVFLLPIFFAYTGLRTQIGLLNHPQLWWFTILLILAASAGKFGGSTLAARVMGMGWRDSSAIGILMNTRGLMELVILNIGRDLGVITEAVFAMMVIMALTTTAMTTPALHLVHPKVEEEAEQAGREEEEKRPFTVLIPLSRPASGGPLATMAAYLAPAAAVARRIIALNLQRPTDRATYISDLVETSQRGEALAPLLEAAKAHEVPTEAIGFVSRDVPADIARVARVRRADLILMGFHMPVFGRAILGGTVHRVLTSSDTDVAVFVDRGLPQLQKILVPYLGGHHDRLALELAGRISRNAGAELTVLHVVAPRRSAGDATLHAKALVEKTFSDPTQTTAIQFQVIEDASPVQAVLDHGKDFDLVVIGVEEQWGMESHLFGWRPERIARQLTTSLLIVRRFDRPRLGPAVIEEAAAPAGDA